MIESQPATNKASRSALLLQQDKKSAVVEAFIKSVVLMYNNISILRGKE
jgi:hypothetical protein